MLRFVHRVDGETLWDADDLDVYCGLGRGERMVALFEMEGYRAKVLPGGDGFDRPYVDETAISCVVRMERRDGRAVDVVVSTCHSALAPIARYYASHVVNVVTASSICVAYPDSTFQRRGFFRPWAARTWNRVRAVEKYMSRGYALVGFSKNVEASVEGGTGSRHFYCPHQERSFADSGTLRLWYGETDDWLARSADDALLREVKWKWGGYCCTCCVKASGQAIMVIKRKLENAGAS